MIIAHIINNIYIYIYAFAGMELIVNYLFLDLLSTFILILFDKKTS